MKQLGKESTPPTSTPGLSQIPSAGPLIHILNYASAPGTTTEIVDPVSSLRAVAAVLYLERRIDND
jgi:hypothetical protein